MNELEVSLRRLTAEDSARRCQKNASIVYPAMPPPDECRCWRVSGWKATFGRGVMLMPTVLAEDQLHPR
jgi:hypothetical protein